MPDAMPSSSDCLPILAVGEMAGGWSRATYGRPARGTAPAPGPIPEQVVSPYELKDRPHDDPRRIIIGFILGTYPPKGWHVLGPALRPGYSVVVRVIAA